MTKNITRKKVFAWPFFIKIVCHFVFTIFAYITYFDWLDTAHISTFFFVVAALAGLLLFLTPELSPLATLAIFYFGLPETPWFSYVITIGWFVLLVYITFKYDNYFNALAKRKLEMYK